MAVSATKIVMLPANTTFADGSNWSNRWYLNYKYSPLADQLILNCSNSAASGLGSTGCGKITKSVTDVAIYTISYFNDIRSIHRHVLTRWQALYTLELNHTILHKVNTTLLINMKPADVDSYIEEVYYIELPLIRKSHATYYLSYDYTKSILLKPPYKTNCFDYKTVGLDSHAHCYDNCVFYASIRNNIISLLIHRRENLDYLPVRIMVSNYKCPVRKTGDNVLFNNACDLMIRTKCKVICKRNDCVKEIFEVKLEEITSVLQSEANIKIHIIAPNSLSTIITHIPNISLVDYITYLLSCFSFWVGLSPLGFLLHLNTTLMKRHLSRLMSKPNTIEPDSTLRVPNSMTLMQINSNQNNYDGYQQTKAQIPSILIRLDVLRNDVNIIQNSILRIETILGSVLDDN